MTVLPRAARRASYELRRLPLRLQGKHRMNGAGSGVLGFIDVGSAGGLPAPWDRHAYLIRRMLRFEPRDAQARDPNVTTLDVALWERDETRNFYVNHVADGSSLFPQNLEYVRTHFATLRERGSPELADSWFERSALSRTERLPCRALDGVLAELDEPFDFLKIDAQGAEHQILKGAEGFLQDHCIALHLEVWTIPLYEGISLLPELEDWLECYDFSLVYKASPHGTFHSQHDCLFMKPGDSPRHDAVRLAYGIGRP